MAIAVVAAAAFLSSLSAASVAYLQPHWAIELAVRQNRRVLFCFACAHLNDYDEFVAAAAILTAAAAAKVKQARRIEDGGSGDDTDQGKHCEDSGDDTDQGKHCEDGSQGGSAEDVDMSSSSGKEEESVAGGRNVMNEMREKTNEMMEKTAQWWRDLLSPPPSHTPENTAAGPMSAEWWNALATNIVKAGEDMKTLGRNAVGASGSGVLPEKDGKTSTDVSASSKSVDEEHAADDTADEDLEGSDLSIEEQGLVEHPQPIVEAGESSTQGEKIVTEGEKVNLGETDRDGSGDSSKGDDTDEVHEQQADQRQWWKRFSFPKPQVQVPQVQLPQMQFPQMTLPPMQLPQMTLPQMQLPQMSLPNVQQQIQQQVDQMRQVLVAAPATASALPQLALANTMPSNWRSAFSATFPEVVGEKGPAPQWPRRATSLSGGAVDARPEEGALTHEMDGDHTHAAPPWFDPEQHEKVIALSVDDAPSLWTEEVLDILKEYDAHCTFFIIGAQVEVYSDPLDPTDLHEVPDHESDHGPESPRSPRRISAPPPRSRTVRSPQPGDDDQGKPELWTFSPDDHRGVGLMHRMLTEGHELGNHTWYDRPSILLPRATFEEEILKMDKLIHSAHEKLHGPKQTSFLRSQNAGSPTDEDGDDDVAEDAIVIPDDDGVSLRKVPVGTEASKVPKWFRPGGGWFTDRIVSTVQRHGYRTALGCVFPHDPHVTNPRVNAWHVLRGVHPGAVIVLHDARQRILETLRVVLPELKRKGYRVCTLSEAYKWSLDGMRSAVAKAEKELDAIGESNNDNGTKAEREDLVA
ncbi:hypothetical protein BJ742DRAFT_872248 [Cladochytrium replicatum]|nr:hypothetical protein BJ742DRAFT_872248 [Cladochytrium replicatum]